MRVCRGFPLGALSNTPFARQGGEVCTEDAGHRQCKTWSFIFITEKSQVPYLTLFSGRPGSCTWWSIGVT